MRLHFIAEAKEKLDLVDLPYELSGLQPVMSKNSVQYHYDILSRGYVDKFNR